MVTSLPTIPKEAEFRAWIDKRKMGGPRFAADIASRAKRVATMIELSKCKTDQDVEIRLMQATTFKRCSQSVRSQLKRAATLYVEFARGPK